MSLEKGDRIAPDGYVWVCLECGKIAREDRYGNDGKCSRGWDESCVINSQLFKEENLTIDDDGLVICIRVDEEDDETLCSDPERLN